MFIYFSKWFLQHGTWSLKAAQDGEVLLFPCSLASSTSPKRLQSNETKCRPRQSFLSFQSYKYKVPCLSCPFCTLLEKSTVWKVQYSVLCLNWKDLKASANVYTAFYNLQICTGSGKQLMKPLCKMSHLVLFVDAPWQELPLLLHCLHFLSKETCEETTVISLAVADSLEAFWVLHAGKQFLRFPFMPASKRYCIQLKPWLAQNLWNKPGTVAVRS